ncbi:MAG: DUF4837 family protein [Owenweeksia sp.]
MIRRFVLLFCSVWLAACNTESPEGGSVFKDALPESNGGRMDLIVVAKESLWQGIAGDEFRKYFSSPQPGLPQPEPEFTVRQIEPKSFNTLLKRSRNIVVLETGDFGHTTQSDFWAKPQLVVNLAAEDEQALAGLIRSKGTEIFNQLKSQEIQVLQKQMGKAIHKKLPVLTRHNVTMAIPTSFEVEIEQENLLVLWNKTIKTDQGLIIYFQPMSNDMNALGTEIIPLRDSLTALYIQSDREGAYMVTEDLVAPTMTNMEIAGTFAMETRGLWRTKNDFKGGPFLNYTIYDEKNNQVIFIDGFVFSPETKKRNFVLELESILRTLEITN